MEVCRKTVDSSVGPNCIVVLRQRRNAKFDHGGSHWCYAGDKQENNCGGVPTIGQGMDIHALANIAMKDFMEQLKD